MRPPSKLSIQLTPSIYFADTLQVRKPAGIVTVPNYRSSTTNVDTRNKRAKETGGEGQLRAFFYPISLSLLSLSLLRNDSYASAQDYKQSVPGSLAVFGK